MNKQILILMIVCLLVTTVIAIDTKPIGGIKPQPLPIEKAKLGLSDTQLNKLSYKNISNVNIVEYPCEEDRRCFSVEGDINEKLISIPIQVKDNCIKKEYPRQVVKVINTTVQINNKTMIVPKSVLYNVTERRCTGEYNYREITEEEVDTITNNALNKLLERQITKEADTYYPIKEDVQVKSKPIKIGVSIGDWIQKTIKQISDAVGLN